MPAPPLGETLTWPPAPLGAVATKKTRWRSMNARSESSMASNSLAMTVSIGTGGLTPCPPLASGLRRGVLEVLLRLLERILGRVRHVGVVLDVVDRVAGGVRGVLLQILGAGLDLRGGVLGGLRAVLDLLGGLLRVVLELLALLLELLGVLLDLLRVGVSTAGGEAERADEEEGSESAAWGEHVSRPCGWWSGVDRHPAAGARARHRGPSRSGTLILSAGQDVRGRERF